MYLVYLSFPFVNLILGHGNRTDWIATLSMVAIFLPLYFTSYWIEGPKVLWVAAGMASLGVVGVFINPGANVFFIYAAAVLGSCGPPAKGARWLLVLVALIGLQAWFFDLHPWIWAPGIFFSLIVGAICIHSNEVQRTNKDLRLAHDEVERLAKLAEQERIARDLHDLLGHTLSVIVVKAELARKIADRDPERAIVEIGEVEQIAREALTKVRHAVEGYRISGGEGLELEFQNARRALDSAEVELEIDIGSQADRLRLGPQQEAVLALALREAVTNVLRHANATSCRIDLVIEPDTARLEVHDDGRGGNEADGSGLSGMRKRVEALGGKMVRTAHRGTNLEISLPLNIKGDS